MIIHPLETGTRVVVNGNRGTVYKFNRTFTDEMSRQSYQYVIDFDDGCTRNVDQFWVSPFDEPLASA